MALPNEILHMITSHLALQSIFRLSRTCRYLPSVLTPVLFSRARETRLTWRAWPRKAGRKRKGWPYETAAQIEEREKREESSDYSFCDWKSERTLLLPGNSVLHWAFLRGKTQLAKYLLSQTQRDPDFDINATRNAEWKALLKSDESKLWGPKKFGPRCLQHATLLQCAVAGRHPELVELLLKNGADPNLKGEANYHFRATSPKPLVLACGLRDQAIVEILIRYGVRDDSGYSEKEINTFDHSVPG